MSLGESRENGQEAEELVLLSLKKRKLGVEGTPGEGSEEGNDLFSMPTVRRARSGGHKARRCVCESPGVLIPRGRVENCLDQHLPEEGLGGLAFQWEGWRRGASAHFAGPMNRCNRPGVLQLSKSMGKLPGRKGR